jgi:hypothetical protein
MDPMKLQPAADNGSRKRGGRQQALARGLSIRAAAEECRVGERTVHTWLAEDPDFRPRVEGLRAELFGQAVGRLCDVSGKAADVLGELLEAENEHVRLQAARSVLEYAPRLREVADLAAQLAELRAELEVLKHGPADQKPAGGGAPHPW